MTPRLILLSPLQLHNAANANQKEKYEADLKKEIKKLQVNATAGSRNLPNVAKDVNVWNRHLYMKDRYSTRYRGSYSTFSLWPH